MGELKGSIAELQGVGSQSYPICDGFPRGGDPPSGCPGQPGGHDNRQPAAIDIRFPPFNKAINDFGKTATRLTIDSFANKHATAELAARVDGLEEKTSKIINPAA
ncbi:MAG TPA: hypothetical protein VMB03_04250 [Bryobacteraceae bacterium]|nr:hypothetical protein [Bryobacteraceae bacterium]